MTGYEIRIIDNQKGKGLFATKTFKEGDVILEEYPIVSCQFAWNAAYKYLACDFCMRPLEAAEQNVRRLAAKPDLVLPYPECCNTNLELIVLCEGCGVAYCSESCKGAAYDSYHRTLCYNPTDVGHPLTQLMDAWKQIHYPPETTSMMLLVRILAMIKQSQDGEMTCNLFKQFCHRTVNEDAQLIHKMLGDKFINQLDMMREMTAKVMSGDHIQQFLTVEGFTSLMALIGTNGQGIGTSPIAQWSHNVMELPISEEEKQKVEQFIDQIYEYMDKESGTFLNTEGSGLYQLQSTCNHSCIPNAEPSFASGNHLLQLKALSKISPGDEISISYLDECLLGRSRHTRQKELATNYLFTCSCEKCMNQASDPEETSEEEMSEDGEEDLEDMSD